MLEDVKIIKGEDMTEKDKSGLILAKFTGTLKENSHKTLGELTKYTSFLEGQESKTYNVKKETELLQKDFLIFQL